MGFMAGLGKGFANSFSQASAQRAAREQDAFRVAYDEYQRKREEFDTKESEWNKAIKQGEMLAQKYGAPPDAGLKAAEWLFSGTPYNAVDEMVANSKFSAAPTVDEASQINPVDNQMQDAGLAPATPETPQGAAEANNPVAAPLPDPNAQPQQNTDLLGGILGPDGIFKNAGKSDMEQAQSQVMEAGGIDQQTWDQVNTGFKMPDTSNIKFETTRSSANPLAEFGMAEGVTKAKFNAADVAAKQWAKSTNPEDIAKAQRWEALKPDLEVALSEDIDPQTKADLLKPLQESAKYRMELAKQRGAAKTMLDQGKILTDMAEASEGRVLTATSGGVSFFEGIKTEAGAIFDLVGKWGGEDGKDEQTVLSAALAELDAKLGGGNVTPEIAQEYREFTAASIRYIFAVGRSLGTEGNGFSNKDYENIRNALLTSNNKDAFINNLKRMTQEQFNAVDNSVRELKTMPEIDILWNDEIVGTSLRKQLMSSDEMFADDPAYKWMKSPMTKANDPLNKDGITPAVEAPEQKIEDTQTTGQSPIGTLIQGPDDSIWEKTKDGPDSDAGNWTRK